MSRDQRLGALRAAMMEGPVPASSPAMTTTPGSPNVSAVINQLRAALTEERKARLAAEERLRRVLATIASQTPRADRTIPVPGPISVEEVIETNELPQTTRDAIIEMGGDDFDEEDSE